MSTHVQSITRSVHQMGWLADTRRWDDLVDVFADTVDVDYTALTGGDPAQVPAGQLVAGWSQSLGALDATQHLLGSILVDVDEGGAEASATAQFQATHIATLDGEPESWTLGGHYAFGLTRDSLGEWRIRSVTMTPTWSTGDDSLLARAAEQRHTV